jgi:hypothetical protein
MLSKIAALASLVAPLSLILATGTAHADEPLPALAEPPAASPSASPPADTVEATLSNEDAVHPYFDHAPLGIYAEAGIFTGVGGGLRLGNRVGLLGSVAWEPLFVQYADARSSEHFKLFNTLQVNANAYVEFWHPTPRSDVGLMGGYRYDSLLGHGGDFGFMGEYALSKHVGLQLLAGIAVYPEGDQLLQKRLASSDEVKGSPWVQAGANIGFVLFP